MTMILLFEAINKGTLKWDDVLTCSAYAASMGGSQVYLEEGERMSVSDLFKAISIASGNDACVMVGERIAGSNEGFVKMMNEKAKELKLKNTHFMNPNGLWNKDHYTSPYDMALIGRAAMQNENFRTIASTKYYDIGKSNKRKYIDPMGNHHKMLNPLPWTCGPA